MNPKISLNLWVYRVFWAAFKSLFISYQLYFYFFLIIQINGEAFWKIIFSYWIWIRESLLYILPNLVFNIIIMSVKKLFTFSIDEWNVTNYHFESKITLNLRIILDIGAKITVYVNFCCFLKIFYYIYCYHLFLFV